jgi:hypothetical protein
MAQRRTGNAPAGTISVSDAQRMSGYSRQITNGTDGPPSAEVYRSVETTSGVLVESASRKSRRLNVNVPVIVPCCGWLGVMTLASRA